jgi:CRISPR type I-E-associated protein CasB/Cse2
MSDISPKERAAGFVGKLLGIRENRGKLAALRRGMSSATVMDAWPVVASLGGTIGQVGESPYMDIAALYASHPVVSTHRNFGETCRAIARADSKDREVPESYERRFRRLLSCGDPSDLVGQLRSWVRLAASKGIGVNYEGLFADVWNWRYYADGIRVKWAKSFWTQVTDQHGEAVEEVAET